MDAYSLLLVMSRPESGISDYWRTRITNLLDTVPQAPRVYAEVVEEEPAAVGPIIEYTPPEATEVNAAV